MELFCEFCMTEFDDDGDLVYCDKCHFDMCFDCIHLHDEVCGFEDDFDEY